MHLSWFSPLRSARTDIAHYTARILPSLRARADVTLWTDEPSWDHHVEDHAPVHRFASRYPDWAAINRGLPVYNIGNNADAHAEIWRVSRRLPGLVVLHDQRLQHFFGGLYKAEDDRAGYLAAMTDTYGPRAAAVADDVWCGRRTVDEVGARYPLTPLALANALGVVVHTLDLYDDLKRLQRWPVHHAPLPYPATPGWGQRPIEDAVRQVAEGPCRLIVFGYIGTNRRLTTLLKALAVSPHRDRFRLDVYGELHFPDAAHAAMRALGVCDLVHVHGFVPEAQLDAALASAHLAINLRYPTMGEASGSQLRLWNHALPSLVSDVGWYATLPPTAVSFVNPDRELDDVLDHLHGFLADPRPYFEQGKAGRRVLEQLHDPVSYTAAVVEFAERLLPLRTRGLAGGLCERAGATLGAWAPGDRFSATYSRVASEIHRLAS